MKSIITNKEIIDMNDSNIELLCPICKSEVKEYVNSFICRNTSCKTTFKKKFSISDLSVYEDIYLKMIEENK